MTVAAGMHEMKEGDLIPSFSLPGVNVAGQISPWDYKQHKNLVLIFFDVVCERCRSLLQELTGNYDEYRELNTEVLAIVEGDVKEPHKLQQELPVPFPLLFDSNREVFSLYARKTADQRLSFGVFITDRWGALFTKILGTDPKRLPTESEIRGWLSFIEIQCPECFPPERVQ